MIALMNIEQAQKRLAHNARLARLARRLTQAQLAERAGVSLATLRKFERSGIISLVSYLKLQIILGGLQRIVAASETEQTDFKNIDEVIAANKYYSPNRRIRNSRS